MVIFTLLDLNVPESYYYSTFTAQLIEENKFLFSFQELKLRREVILLLAYIASHGRSGFEVLLAPVRPHGVNFLESIVQVLASVMDAEIVDCAEAQALCAER